MTTEQWQLLVVALIAHNFSYPIWHQVHGYMFINVKSIYW